MKFKVVSYAFFNPVSLHYGVLFVPLSSSLFCFSCLCWAEVIMESQNQDVEDLSSKISTLGWDEFHTLLSPVIPDEDVLILSVVGKILTTRIFSSSGDSHPQSGMDLC